MARVEIWLQAGGRWRWRYQDRAGVIPSNRGFARFDDAVASAARAYPGLQIVELRPRVPTAGVVAAAAAIILFVLVARSRHRTREPRR